MASLVLAGAVLPGAAQAVDSVSLEIGAGKNVQIARVGAQWDWQRQWLPSASGHLGGYWDLTAASWRQGRYQGVPGAHRSISDIGLTPVFRYQTNERTGLYVEAGIGAHYLSSQYDNGGHQLATRFEFGDHLAAGYRFGQGWEASAKLQHFSNGGVKHPNGGANFLIVRVAKQF
jgi:lipid A 3-O-deacylase